jgi:hypothetical protein
MAHIMQKIGEKAAGHDRNSQDLEKQGGGKFAA